MNQQIYLKGLKDAIPVGLGYLAVSFSLGITAANSGLNPFQTFLSSALNNASAGQYAGYRLIAANATYLEIALVTLIANARYALMSSAMTQRLSPDMPLKHRFLMPLGVTDEIFALSINQEGHLNPFYTYGAMTSALIPWALGSTIGAIAGQILPPSLVSALSVALYGMFIAIIIPDTRRSKVLAYLVGISFAVSFIANSLPFFAKIPSGVMIIILTVVIASGAAILFPLQKAGGQDE